MFSFSPLWYNIALLIKCYNYTHIIYIWIREISAKARILVTETYATLHSIWSITTFHARGLLIWWLEIHGQGYHTMYYMCDVLCVISDFTCAGYAQVVYQKHIYYSK